jgi:hypothetical protein
MQQMLRTTGFFGEKMKTILCFFVFLWVCPFGAFSEQIIATFDITSAKGSLSDPRNVENLIALRNTDQKEWLVVWTELQRGDITSKKVGLGRRVADSGNLSASKKVQKNAAVFDAAYDPDHGIYMFLVERFDTLNAQAYKATLAKQGPPQDLSKSFSNNTTIKWPQIVYSPDTQTFRVYVVTRTGNCSPASCFEDIQMLNLDQTGKALSTPVVVTKGKNGRQSNQLEAFRNPESDNVLLLFNDSETFGPTTVPRTILGFVAKPDGKLLKQKAFKVASNQPCSGLTLIGAAAFDLSKSGIIGWSFLACDGSFQQTNFRRIKTTEKGLTPTKRFPSGSFPVNFQHSVAIVFDELNDEYVILWHDAGTLKGSRVNASTGNFVGAEFTLATVNLDPFAGITDIEASYDSASGRVLAIWTENLGSNRFQVRGSVFKK